MATLFLICGLPGSGKTTLARKIEAERSALRLSPDEWMTPLFGADLDPSKLEAARAPVEAVQWSVASRALTLGMDVVLEYGFWSRREREEYRSRTESLGARVQLCFLDVPLEKLWKRLEKRNADLPLGSFLVEKNQLELWWSWFEKPTAEELA